MLSVLSALLGFVLGFILAMGLILQTRAIVARVRSARGTLWKYISLFGFVAIFYFLPSERMTIGISYVVGTILGLCLGIVAKQRRLR